MKLISESVEDTHAIARLVAAHLKGGEIILLNGELGAGKTTFTKGLARALGVEKTVISPTFTIMKEYYGRFTLVHIDMYRIEDEAETQELGLLEERDNETVTVIEWNKFKNLTGKIINIDIEKQGENKRLFNVEGFD